MWLDKQVSLYTTHSDNTGRPASYREILLTRFIDDLPTIMELRKLDRFRDDYKLQAKPFKSSLQCYTPAALLKSKAKNNVIEIDRPGMMQLDFDFEAIKDYDIEELKHCVFSLPFIGFCGLSSSGYGFYALALIAEPYKLYEYAEHCFEILKGYGINPDEGKGKKPENLRYLSYDQNMLIRDNPEPLRIKHFKTKQAPKKEFSTNYTVSAYKGNDGLIKASLKMLQSATTGQRWPTVQHVAYTLGGLLDHSLIDLIKNEINNNSEFNGEESKYHKCADDCFSDGMLRPLIK